MSPSKLAFSLFALSGTTKAFVNPSVIQKKSSQEQEGLLSKILLKANSEDNEQSYLKDYQYKLGIFFDPDCVPASLENGADPNMIVDKLTGDSALHKVCKKSVDNNLTAKDKEKYNQLAKELIFVGADPEQENYFGLTANMKDVSSVNDKASKTINMAISDKSDLKGDELYKQSSSISLQSLKDMTNPKLAIVILINSIVNQKVDIHRKFENQNSISSLIKENWPKDQSDQFHALDACLRNIRTISNQDKSNSFPSKERKDLMDFMVDQIVDLTSYSSDKQRNDR